MGYEFDWGLPFRAPYIHWLFKGLLYTLLLMAVSSVGSFLLGIALALCRRSKSHLLRVASLWFVEIFRGIPTLVWILFFCFVLPTLLGPAAESWLNRWPGLPLASALAGLLLSNAGSSSPAASRSFFPPADSAWTTRATRRG